MISFCLLNQLTRKGGPSPNLLYFYVLPVPVFSYDVVLSCVPFNYKQELFNEL